MPARRKKAKPSNVTELRLVRRWTEFRPKGEIKQILSGARGLYALLWYRPKLDMYDVVYIGMARGQSGIKSRLRSHKRSKSKGAFWTHFSAFEVWPNIREEEIGELEGLFRQIYRKDTRANKINQQRSFKKLKRVEGLLKRN